MRHKSMVLKDGEGVWVNESCEIKVYKLNGQGKNRRRCIVFFENRTGEARRIPCPEETEGEDDVGVS